MSIYNYVEVENKCKKLETKKKETRFLRYKREHLDPDVCILKCRFLLPELLYR